LNPLKVFEVASMSGGRLADLAGNHKAVDVLSVSIDSRQVQAGDLFIAICGQRFDGHDFVDSVMKSDCSALMLAKEKAAALTEGAGPLSKPVILVEDTCRALGRLARAYRPRFSYPWIAITGSCGKSTTKELIACVLGPRELVHKAAASFNNHIGVPLTILGADDRHSFAVVEIGSNHKGEILPLAQMTAPDVAVITCIAEAHLEGFGDLQGVADEKSDILSALRADGTAILNSDDAWFDFLKARTDARIISFGFDQKADVYASNIKLGSAGSSFALTDGSQVQLQLPGQHNIANALAAAAAGRAVGIDFPEIARRLSQARAMSMRSDIRLLGKLQLLDDCYNANPASFVAALSCLCALESRRKVVIAGEMAELGHKSELLHRQLGQQIAESGIDLLIGVGPGSQATVQAAVDAAEKLNHQIDCQHFAEAASAGAGITELILGNDAVLVKGSRSNGLESVVQVIVEAFREGDK
jgi:UDP-N-acetylmuramoyl-tripeptide--D-alanyl-D-alanine ligase